MRSKKHFKGRKTKRQTIIDQTWHERDYSHSELFVLEGFIRRNILFDVVGMLCWYVWLNECVQVLHSVHALCFPKDISRIWWRFPVNRARSKRDCSRRARTNERTQPNSEHSIHGSEIRIIRYRHTIHWQITTIVYLQYHTYSYLHHKIPPKKMKFITPLFMFGWIAGTQKYLLCNRVIWDAVLLCTYNLYFFVRVIPCSLIGLLTIDFIHDHPFLNYDFTCIPIESIDKEVVARSISYYTGLVCACT